MLNKKLLAAKLANADTDTQNKYTRNVSSIALGNYSVDYIVVRVMFTAASQAIKSEIANAKMRNAIYSSTLTFSAKHTENRCIPTN